jgi:nucleoside-diphosphate kinase
MLGQPVTKKYTFALRDPFPTAAPQNRNSLRARFSSYPEIPFGNLDKLRCPAVHFSRFTSLNLPQAVSEELMERTLSIVKPDGVERGLIGEVIKRFEDNGLKIIGLKMVRMSKREAEGFYAVHRGKSFFESLTAFMSSGPAVVMVLDNAIQSVRNLMGATNPGEASEGTLRRQFGSNIERNLVHGSDGPDTASFEIGYFFPAFEIVA